MRSCCLVLASMILGHTEVKWFQYGPKRALEVEAFCGFEQSDCGGDFGMGPRVTHRCHSFCGVDSRPEGVASVMSGNPVDLEGQRLRERAATLREIAETANPAGIAGQLLEVAEELDRRAARSELLAKQKAA